MQKYTKSEEVEVLSPAQHKAVQDQLHKVGKTSAEDLTDEEREALNQRIANSQ